MKFSNESLEYLDPETNEKYIPYIIESTYGCDRMVLAILDNSYCEEELENGETREVMHFIPAIAPYKACILPLIKKNHSDKAMEIFNALSKYFMVSYDESGSIGKRYRRNDAIGTPFSITVDDETLNNNTVTVRDRDTMQQVTINVDELVDYIEKKIEF